MIYRQLDFFDHYNMIHLFERQEGSEEQKTAKKKLTTRKNLAEMLNIIQVLLLENNRFFAEPFKYYGEQTWRNIFQNFSFELSYSLLRRQYQHQHEIVEYRQLFVKSLFIMLANYIT